MRACVGVCYSPIAVILCLIVHCGGSQFFVLDIYNKLYICDHLHVLNLFHCIYSI